MKRHALASLLLLSSLQPLSSFAAEKHVHGEAELFIAVEGKKVLIEMESPADNFLGFEHEPRTDKQKALVTKTNALLQSHSNLITLNGGGCKQVDAFIESPFIEHQDEHKHGHHDEHKDEQ